MVAGSLTESSEQPASNIAPAIMLTKNTLNFNLFTIRKSTSTGRRRMQASGGWNGKQKFFCLPEHTILARFISKIVSKRHFFPIVSGIAAHVALP